MGTLYENIKSLCDENGISGSKMCIDLSLSKSLMTKLKNEPGREISSETAVKIADYFHVSTDRILYGKEDIKKEPILPKEDELNPDYALLNSDNKALIDAMIANLLKAQSSD